MNRALLPVIACTFTMSFAISAMAAPASGNPGITENNTFRHRVLFEQVKEEMTNFDSDNARKMAETAGFNVLTDPEKKNDRYIMLGEKGGFYSELHVNKDGKVYTERMVDRNDPHWRSKINR